MLMPVLAVAFATVAAPICPAAVTPTSSHRSETLEALYRGGRAFNDFLAAAQARKQLWHANWERATVPEPLLERARAVPGTWRLLAVSVDGCSDSVSTIPFIAKLVEQVPGLEMRIIDNVIGMPVMEAHRTPDGRPATPTLILINEAWEEAGCWVERPGELQVWYLEKQKELGNRELVAQKMAWYQEDAGATTLREIVERLEAASRGERICG